MGLNRSLLQTVKNLKTCHANSLSIKKIKERVTRHDPQDFFVVYLALGQKLPFCIDFTGPLCLKKLFNIFPYCTPQLNVHSSDSKTSKHEKNSQDIKFQVDNHQHHGLNPASPSFLLYPPLLANRSIHYGALIPNSQLTGRGENKPNFLFPSRSLTCEKNDNLFGRF